jgi:hypothetical protein
MDLALGGRVIQVNEIEMIPGKGIRIDLIFPEIKSPRLFLAEG